MSKKLDNIEKARILREYSVFMKHRLEEFDSIDRDKDYSHYHLSMMEWCIDYAYVIRSVIGYPKDDYSGNQVETFIDSLDDLSDEQMDTLKYHRRSPIYIKIMGEDSLQYKTELESTLESKIELNGMPMLTEKGILYTYKTVEQLEKEFTANDTKLGRLLEKGLINMTQYYDYYDKLDYIYDYYISCSKGDQNLLTKLDNKSFDPESFYKSAEEYKNSDNKKSL